MRITGFLTGLLFTTATFGQSIVTPVFVHKDGDASVVGYTGSEKELVVNGGNQQSVGWITFQTQGIDFSKTISAKLSLYVKAVTIPGTLQIRLLKTEMTAPENNVRISDIPADSLITTSIALGTADVEKVIQLDLTTSLKAGSFHGVALTSIDGLFSALDSREGNLAPVILLTNSIDSVLAGKVDTVAGKGLSDQNYTEAEKNKLAAISGTNTGDQDLSGLATKSELTTGLAGKIDNVTGKKLSTKDYTEADSAKLAAISGTNTGDQDLSGLATKSELTTSLAVKVDNVTGKKLSTKDYTEADSTKLAGIAVNAVVNRGDMQYWDGTRWMKIAISGANQVLTCIGADSIPAWRKRPMGSVMDMDGNIYQTVVIGNQEWTLTNIRTTRYNDGTAIPIVTDSAAWAGLTTGAYCYYNNNSTNALAQQFGALYNWYAVGKGKLAPNGWRVPTEADWIALENYLRANGFNYDGTDTSYQIAKSMATGFWDSDTGAPNDPGAIGINLGANNKSGFSALPAGIREGESMFLHQGYGTFWWGSDTSTTDPSAYSIGLITDFQFLYADGAPKYFGLSVRLVRDLN